MSAHHHRRRSALVTACAGCLALVLVAPAHATYPGHNGLLAFHSETDAGQRRSSPCVPTAATCARSPTSTATPAVPTGHRTAGRIAFTIETSDSAQIAIVDADGGPVTLLAKAPGNIIEVDPSFTPDGRRLVFISHNLTPNGEVEILWSMKLDGTDRRPIKTATDGRPERLTRRPPARVPGLQRRAVRDRRCSPAASTAATPSSSRRSASTSASSSTGPPTAGNSPSSTTTTSSPGRVREHRDDPPGRNRPAIRDQLPRRDRSTPSSAPTRPMAAGSCSDSKTTAATASTRSAPTARTCARSSASRTSRRATSTGARARATTATNPAAATTTMAITKTTRAIAEPSDPRPRTTRTRPSDTAAASHRTPLLGDAPRLRREGSTRPRARGDAD